MSIPPLADKPINLPTGPEIRKRLEPHFSAIADEIIRIRNAAFTEGISTGEKTAPDHEKTCR